jgi:hypothetical protein
LLLSALAYALIIRSRREGFDSRNGQQMNNETSLARPADTGGISGRIRQISAIEQDWLAAVTGGFAVTIVAWLAILSFGSERWLELFAGMPPWIYSFASLAVWLVATQAIYGIRRRGRNPGSTGSGQVGKQQNPASNL